MVFSSSFRVSGLILRFARWHLHWMRERGLMSFLLHMDVLFPSNICWRSCLILVSVSFGTIVKKKIRWLASVRVYFKVFWSTSKAHVCFHAHTMLPCSIIWNQAQYCSFSWELLRLVGVFTFMWIFGLFSQFCKAVFGIVMCIALNL